MGIIRAVLNSVGGSFADQYKEVIMADEMSDATLFCGGVQVRFDAPRNANTKGTKHFVTDGSIVRVDENQFMVLVDGGKIIDYTAEPGYYKVDNKAAPSFFNGAFKAVLKESLARIQFGGQPSGQQDVYFINLQEIKGIKFGTPNPINYFDGFYNAELYLRAFGTYSIKVSEPLTFYREVCPKNQSRLSVDDLNQQFVQEFLNAFQAMINSYSKNGERISYIVSKGPELSQYMSEALDEQWNKNRGFEVQDVAIASISYDEKSQALIELRNQGAMLGDPAIREGYVQGAVARGIEAAGSNAAGSAQAFMGVGLGANMSGNIAGVFSENNQAAMHEKQKASTAAGKDWTCVCSQVNPGDAQFCSACGKPRPTVSYCPQCGHEFIGEIPNFCPDCGHKFSK